MPPHSAVIDTYLLRSVSEWRNIFEEAIQDNFRLTIRLEIIFS